MTLLKDKRIVLGVTGSIAAYKAADLAGMLVKQEADVHVVLTPHASEFIGAVTFRTLTRNPVLSGLFDEPASGAIAHIDLAQSSDLILIAPATANILAKMAHGIADDLLSSLLLAATSPILTAPAMNTHMWQHSATQANIKTLLERGVHFVEPGVGMLACRYEGKGRLAETDEIISAVSRLCSVEHDLMGKRVLITAGATREPIDPVRFISNRSSGKMGVALAEEAIARGAHVTMICGAITAAPPSGVDIVQVSSTEEMLDACVQAFPSCDIMIAAAAPADYTPVQPESQKIKKKGGQELVIRLTETPDIVAAMAMRKTPKQLIIGFAAETTNTICNATEKLKRKNLDMIIANDVSQRGAGFEGDTNIITILRPNHEPKILELMSKRDAAHHIFNTILTI